MTTQLISRSDTAGAPEIAPEEFKSEVSRWALDVMEAVRSALGAKLIAHLDSLPSGALVAHLTPYRRGEHEYLACDFMCEDAMNCLI